MNDDYYHSDVDKEILKDRTKGINRRWKELYELESEAEKEALKFLFITNSGGAVATLSFMGASENIRNNGFAVASLILFVVGLVLLGITRAIILKKLNSVFRGYKSDVFDYFDQEKRYRQVLNNDEERSKSIFQPYLFGCLSAIALITGFITGGIALLK